ncbi:MAG: hypothetical protein ABI680_13450 [Chthoniobacteraceae bacterium]
MPARKLVLFAVVTGTLGKLLLAATTHGTNDVDTFYNFGRFIADQGLAALYRADPLFNHLPLTGLFCALAMQLPAFWFVIRLPGILADIFTALALLRIHERTGKPPRWVLVLFALSPLNLMVSGFHGNIDPVLVLALVLAAEACLNERAAACGVWLALAVNLKVIALLVAPALAFVWWRRGAFRSFALPACALALAGWAYPLLTVPREFIGHVLAYGSNWGSWGVTLLLRWFGGPDWSGMGYDQLTPAQIAVSRVLKLAIVASSLVIAWTRRDRRGTEIFTTLSLVWLVFFVAAPGVGPQYLVWIAPFLAVSTPRGYLLTTMTSAIFAFVFYHVVSQGRWFFANSTGDLVARWEAWSLLPWLCFAGLLVFWKTLRSREAPAGS